MQLVQRGQCQQAVNASCYGNTRERDVGAGKIERLRNNNSSGSTRTALSLLAGHGGILALPQGHGHHLEASPGPVPGRVGEQRQQHWAGTGKGFSTCNPVKQFPAALPYRRGYRVSPLHPWTCVQGIKWLRAGHPGLACHANKVASSELR